MLSELSNWECKGLIELAGFIIKCYSVFWFDASNAVLAPLNDIKFLRKLDEYKKINKNFAEKAISKMLNHLYYLSEECVGFVLFDPRISAEIKGKLVKKMAIDTSENSSDENECVPKKFLLKKQDVHNFISRDDSIVLEELFSSNTKNVFKRFNISMQFLESDPKTWEGSEDYRNGKHIVENLKIVNDCAERGIKLIQEYHQKLTKDEEQRQYLFKVNH